MAATIKKRSPMLWMLVKVPQITDVSTTADQTATMLRESIRENHFGGERASVRRLTKAEVRALQWLSDNKPAKCDPATTSQGEGTS